MRSASQPSQGGAGLTKLVSGTVARSTLRQCPPGVECTPRFSRTQRAQENSVRPEAWRLLIRF
jgi:hypothetical protein